MSDAMLAGCLSCEKTLEGIGALMRNASKGAKGRSVSEIYSHLSHDIKRLANAHKALRENST